MVMPTGGLENASGKRWEVGLNDEVEPSELGGGGESGGSRKCQEAQGIKNRCVWRETIFRCGQSLKYLVGC